MKKQKITKYAAFATLLMTTAITHADPSEPTTLIPCDASTHCSISNVPTTPAQFGIGLSSPTIQVQDWGNADAPNVILFLHGFPHSHLMWVNQIKKLDKSKYRVVTMDLRGMGSSYKPLCKGTCTDPIDGYHSSDFADDINNVINSLHLAPNKKLYIVGHSYGADVINDYLLKYGENKLAGIVYVDGVGILQAPSTPAQCGNVFFGGPVLLNTFGPSASPDLATSISAAQAFVTGTFDNVYKSDNKNTVANEILASDMVPPTEVKLAVISRLLGILGNAPDGAPPSIFASITKPLLFIHGTNDQIILPGAPLCASALATSTSPQVKFIKNVGHVPMIEAPLQFNDILTTFINAN